MCIPDGGLRAAWAVVLAAACAGCTALAEPPVPPGWSVATGPGGPGGEGYGAWVVIRTSFINGGALAGELIACRFDSLWVLTESGLRSQALPGIRSVRVYDVDANGHMRVEEVVPDHPSSIASSRESSVAPDRVAELRQWARFPQGWPPGLDPASLRLKPMLRP
jgi:hypothetical protein